MYVAFETAIGLAEQLISAEVIHFGFGSPNENRPLFMVKPKFHRGPYMDQLLHRMISTCNSEKLFLTQLQGYGAIFMCSYLAVLIYIRTKL